VIVIPRRKFLVSLCLPLVFFALGIASASFLTIGIILDVVIFGIGAIDLFSLLSQRPPDIHTEAERVFSINTGNIITFSVGNFSSEKYLFRISLRTPENWKSLSGEELFELQASSKTAITVSFRPLRRGAVVLDGFYFRYTRPNSFFWIQRKNRQKVTIDVIPDVTMLSSVIHFSRTNRLYEMGVHKNAYHGLGTEFESLREYQLGENADKIDWKVSTRVGRPVTRIHQMESNNNITFMIDCGRSMTAEQDGINSLDHSINSMLLLSHLAIQAGDSISLVFFADTIIAEAYNLKGRSAIRKLKQMSAAVTALMVDSDYGKAFTYLSLRLKRRSYIMVISDLLDSVQYATFLKYMQFLQRRHVPLLVLLQDKELSSELEHAPESESELYRSAVASEMYLQRTLSVERLKKHKLMVLDVLPAGLSPPLVNKYYQIKSANML
jgi:uncharacterized protein (DUF58 family)